MTSKISYIKTVDYCGDFIYVNSELKRMLFPGGYVTFRNDSIECPEYHFYITDHQGNVRVVANQNGEVEQVNHYYPYGGLMGESTNSDHQPYKYNGKELDRHHGLDWYDYGARWYNGISWMNPDPHAESYYDVTPYGYCHNNPMNKIDPTGMDDYYTSSGQFLFRDQKETDNIIIRNQFLYYIKSITGAEWIKPDTPIEKSNLSAKTYSDIFTNILKQNGFDIRELKNGSVSIVKLKDNMDYDGTQYKADGFFNHEAVIPAWDADIADSKTTINGIEVTAYIHPMGDDSREYLSTISNVISVLGIHEFTEHQKKGLGENLHWKILENQKKHSSWKKVTSKLKNLYRHFEKNKLFNYNKPL